MFVEWQKLGKKCRPAKPANGSEADSYTSTNSQTKNRKKNYEKQYRKCNTEKSLSDGIQKCEIKVEKIP